MAKDWELSMIENRHMGDSRNSLENETSPTIPLLLEWQTPVLILVASVHETAGGVEGIFESENGPFSS